MHAGGAHVRAVLLVSQLLGARRPTLHARGGAGRGHQRSLGYIGVLAAGGKHNLLRHQLGTDRARVQEAVGKDERVVRHAVIDVNKV